MEIPIKHFFLHPSDRNWLIRQIDMKEEIFIGLNFNTYSKKNNCFINLTLSYMCIMKDTSMIFINF